MLLYSIRDATATVESIPLIVASILSKKFSVNANFYIFDIKVGTGAFIKNLADAIKLKNLLIEITRKFNFQADGIISDMNQPLGYTIGNSLEVKEAIEFMKGERQEQDLKKVTSELIFKLLKMSFPQKTKNELIENMNKVLSSGQVLEKFKKIIEFQGGNPDVVDNPDLLPQAKYKYEIRAHSKGYLNFVNNREIGLAVLEMGGGRKFKDDKIDHSAGIELLCKHSDKIEKNQPLMILHLNSLENISSIESRIWNAIRIDDSPPRLFKLIY